MNSIAESTRAELRSAVAEQLKKPDGPTQELSNILRRAAREARAQDVLPEQFLVFFKEQWNSLAESLRPQNPDQFERVRQRLVTLTIQAYYGE